MDDVGALRGVSYIRIRKFPRSDYSSDKVCVCLVVYVWFHFVFIQFPYSDVALYTTKNNPSIHPLLDVSYQPPSPHSTVCSTQKEISKRQTNE